LLVAGAASAQTRAQAQGWRMQYAYDQAKSELVLQDIQFPSTRRGVAIGSIYDGKGGHKPVAVLTSDGGAHWDVVKLDEMPVSLFFLNDSLGWMVTEKGIWKTNEAGKDWQKLPKPPAAALRVYFIDENNGWAACAKKSVLATHDGGRKWEPVPAAAEPAGAPERSAYTWIGFASPLVGYVFGSNQPAMRWASMFPAWMDPENALSRRETPHLAYQLVTRDGGKTWRAGSVSLLGQVTRVRFSAEGPGLGLIEFGDSYRYPSEVYKLDWTTGKNQTIFRDKRYAITDVWMTRTGIACLAGIELAGQVRSVAPGKVKVFMSADLSSWNEMEVDYRAVAQRATFAGVDEENLWLATDNGMILKLK
jgi:photosystem II stability/assembly factor-like uncharacterized protein